jgi:DNA modification methylase
MLAENLGFDSERGHLLREKGPVGIGKVNEGFTATPTTIPDKTAEDNPGGAGHVNKLYFGDNLDVLRDHVGDETVDLVYLDPPFNSNANYNVLFEAPSGEASEAQVEAFRDTWHWGPNAALAYDDVMQQGGEVALVLSGLRKWLGENAMMAYLAMMAVRLIELHRALKKTGSLYLHCDPKASHYLKIILDAIFGKRGNYRNEIIWCYRKWSVAAGQFVRNHDDIHFLTKSTDEHTFNVQYTEPSKGTMKRWKGQKQQAFFEKGVRKATSLDSEEARSPMPDWWEISIINPNAAERVGYPTQKPLALLKRIIAASSNEGDVILDPFCGSGTTVDAAEELHRHWIGIDVTHYAVTLIESRIKKSHPAVKYSVHGRPTDIAGARDPQYAGFIDSATGRFVKPGIAHKDDGERQQEKPTEVRFAGGGDEPPGIDPIIAGLLKRLPKSGEVWPEADRKLWLELLAGSFKLIYKDQPSGRLPSFDDPDYRARRADEVVRRANQPISEEDQGE